MTANKVAIAIMILIVTIISTYILIQHKFAQQHAKILNLFALPLNNTYWSEATQIIKESQYAENVSNHIFEITKSKYHIWISQLTTSFAFNTKNNRKIRKRLNREFAEKFDTITNDPIFSTFYVTILEQYNLHIIDVTAHIQNACKNIHDTVQSTGAFKIPSKTNDLFNIIEFRIKISIACVILENLDDLIFVNYYGIKLKKYKYKTLQQLQTIRSTFQRRYRSFESNEEAKSDVLSEEEKYDLDEIETNNIEEAIRFQFGDLHNKNPITNLVNIASAFDPDSLKGIDITNIEKHDCKQILNSLLKKYNNNKKPRDKTEYLLSRAVTQICYELKQKM